MVSGGGGGGDFIGDNYDHNFDANSIIDKYKGTNLSYDMLWKPIRSNDEDKERYKITVNRIVNLQNLTTNVEKN